MCCLEASHDQPAEEGLTALAPHAVGFPDGSTWTIGLKDINPSRSSPVERGHQGGDGREVGHGGPLGAVGRLARIAEVLYGRAGGRT